MATTKKTKKRLKRARRAKKTATYGLGQRTPDGSVVVKPGSVTKKRSKVTWTKPKGKLTLVCKHCYEDTAPALPEECQFGKPRGMDIRQDGSNHNVPYCGTCGEDYGVTKVRV
jgi:hypothetical protein